VCAVTAVNFSLMLYMSYLVNVGNVHTLSEVYVLVTDKLASTSFCDWRWLVAHKQTLCFGAYTRYSNMSIWCHISQQGFSVDKQILIKFGMELLSFK